MSFWMQLLVLLLAVGICFWIYTIIKKSPGAFSWANLNKSFFTMGILALILIGFVVILVMMLRHG